LEAVSIARREREERAGVTGVLRLVEVEARRADALALQRFESAICRFADGFLHLLQFGGGVRVLVRIREFRETVEAAQDGIDLLFGCLLEIVRLLFRCLHLCSFFRHCQSPFPSDIGPGNYEWLCSTPSSLRRTSPKRSSSSREWAEIFASSRASETATLTIPPRVGIRSTFSQGSISATLMVQ
jgi:hypothetical protein